MYKDFRTRGFAFQSICSNTKCVHKSPNGSREFSEGKYFTSFYENSTFAIRTYKT